MHLSTGPLSQTFYAPEFDTKHYLLNTRDKQAKLFHENNSVSHSIIQIKNTPVSFWKYGISSQYLLKSR